MSLRLQDPPTVPEETRRVARAAFPKGTLCLHIADALGAVYQDSQFTALFPRRGQPAAAPGRLALALLLQFVENLSDRKAADAVRGRIDWQYALGLALADPGFDHTVLSEFRTRLVEGGAKLLLLDTLLRHLQEQGLGGVDKGASRGGAEVIQGCLLAEGGGATGFADGRGMGVLRPLRGGKRSFLRPSAGWSSSGAGCGVLGGAHRYSLARPAA